MSSFNRLSVSPKLLEIAREIDGIRCIYDCGSRDGLDGLKLLQELGGEELHLFECNPAAIELCRANTESNPGSGRVVVAPYAVAEKSGPLTFYSIDPGKTVTPHADGNIGASSLYKSNPNYPNEQYVQKPIEVTAVCLDDYCQKHTPPDLLWMDLQGAEARAIDGANRTLSMVKIIHVEVSFRRMYLGQALFRDIHQRLESRFRLVDLDVGRWPRLPALYSLLRFGPWVGNAIYVNRDLV